MEKSFFWIFKRSFVFLRYFQFYVSYDSYFFKQWTELCSDKVLDTNNVAFRSFLATLERFEVKFLSQRLPKWRFSGFLRIHQYPFVKHFFEDFLILLRYFQFYMSHDSVLFTNGRNYVCEIVQLLFCYKNSSLSVTSLCNEYRICRFTFVHWTKPSDP